jgi:hypothetical protein
LGSGPFRSPLLRTSRLISLPPGTEMFQFPGFASLRREMTSVTTGRVAPFGHLGIIACVPLPRASRSLPRPSSPPCAQASPTCLLSLDYKVTSPSRTTRITSQSTSLPIPICVPCTTRATARQHHERTMSFGKDSISHESIIDQKTKSMTHPLSFTFQIASATRRISR